MSQESIEVLFFSVWSLIMVVMISRTWILYFIRARKYGGIPPSLESRVRMKFVTQLSKDEVIEGLRSHKPNDIFEYEIRSENDFVYRLWIKGIDQFKGYCKGNAKYRLMIIQKPENTVVWVVLLSCDNETAKERYGWELKGFMEKKIMAVRVE